MVRKQRLVGIGCLIIAKTITDLQVCAAALSSVLYCEVRSMFYEKEIHLWDVSYTDKYGNKQCVRYCARTEEEAKRLFRSEQEHGDVLEGIRKVREQKK